MDKVCAAFVKAQKDFSPALKTSNNPHFKSKYASLDSCVEAVIDALNANGIALQQFSYERDGGVAVETIFIHESGEMLKSGILFVPAVKHDAQGYGSALTYARRYSLMSACGIAPEDDDGNAASNPKSAPKPQAAPKQEVKNITQVTQSEIDSFLKMEFSSVDDIAKAGGAMWIRARDAGQNDFMKTIQQIVEEKKVKLNAN
jgi:hypothetical protein